MDTDVDCIEINSLKNRVEGAGGICITLISSFFLGSSL